MMAPFVGVLSLFLVAAGVLCLYEYTLYSPVQKMSAQRLWRAYLGVIVLVIVLGVVGVVAALLEAPGLQGLLGLLAVAAAFPAFVQYLLHRRLDIDRGPLYERVDERWL